MDWGYSILAKGTQIVIHTLKIKSQINALPTLIEWRSLNTCNFEYMRYVSCYLLKVWIRYVLVLDFMHVFFLHDWSWISPWIEFTFNEFDITIHLIALQLSSHCDVISKRVWRHEPKENRASETRRRCIKIVVLSSFMDSLCREINTKITLSWALKQFVTRVHTLFSISFLHIYAYPVKCQSCMDHCA